MKRIISLVLILVLALTMFCSCGEKGPERKLFSKTNMSKYFEICDYTGIVVDTRTDEWLEIYDSVVESDVETYDLYFYKTEGKVQNGDVVNIDYCGKKDGVAFQGGTAEGHDLEIGSDSFIDGFEDGLIGVEIGSTVDLNLKFPDDYDSADLAGQRVVFTVTVNYVKTDNPEAKEPKDFYSEIGFDSLENYVLDARKRATQEFLFNEVMEKSKVKDYPEKDIETLYKSAKEMQETEMKQSYGLDFATYLSYVGQTEEQFKEDLIKNQIKPMMDSMMMYYALVDDAGIIIEQADIDAQVDIMVKEANNDQVTADVVKDFYGEYFFESLAYREKALNFIYDNAVIL